MTPNSRALPAEVAGVPSMAIEGEGPYAAWGDHLETTGSYIDELSRLKCFVQEIYDPLDFYVTLADYWNQWEIFQKCFNDFYPAENAEPTEERLDDWVTPSHLQDHLLVPGMIAAAYIENEWFRCLIQRYDRQSQICTVLTVDQGREEIVAARDLRLLHEDFFKDLTAQAINCQLYFPAQQVKYIKKVMSRRPEARLRFAQILMDIVYCRQVVVFFRRLTSVQKNDLTWEVDMSLLEEEKPGNVFVLEKKGNVAEVLFERILREFPPEQGA